MIDAEQIHVAFEQEFPGAAPSPELWDRIRTATPALRPAEGARRRWSRLSLALVWGLITLTAGGVALAEAPQVKAVVDKMLGRTQIHLVEYTPAVKQEWQAEGATQTTFEQTTPAAVLGQLPAAMKKPTYLPVPQGDSDVMVQYASQPTWAGAIWQYHGQMVLLSWHNYVFGPGSREGTNGPVQETQELKVNGLEANAFRDNSGWTLMWAMDNNQYSVKVGGLPLDEAVKVAESLK